MPHIESLRHFRCIYTYRKVRALNRLPAKESKHKMTNTRLKTLKEIDSLLNKPSATGEDVGRLFLLSSAEEMKNSRAGANIAPASYEKLQRKANELGSTDDRDTLQNYINLMNSIKNAYNLSAGYKLSVLYRLSGLARITDTIKHIHECVELTDGQGKYTKDFLKQEARTLGSPAIKELLKQATNEARFSYAHNEFISILAEHLHMEELEAYKIHVEEIEAEFIQCMDDISQLLCLIPIGIEPPQLDINELKPAEECIKEAEDFIKDIKNYNNISPTVKPIYILLGRDHIHGDTAND